MTLSTLGIDLAKDKFDVVLRHHDRLTHKVFPNTAEGITALLDWLQAQGHPHVHAGLEDDRNFVEALWTASPRACGPGSHGHLRR